MSTTIIIPQAERLDNEGRQVISMLHVLARRHKVAALDPTDPQYMSLFERLDALLDEVDKVKMTPELKKEAKVEGRLALMCQEDTVFPPEYAERAEALLNRFKAANWGAVTTSTQSSPAAPRRASSITTTRQASVQGERDILFVPPPDHSIFGTNGILHGFAITSDGNRVLDPRYENEQKPSNVFGDNGLQVGDWFAFQLVAKLHGAHGATVGGIYGEAKHGAYSVVVSGDYEGLDSDHGDKLYYSGPESKNWKDKTQPPELTFGSKALQASKESGNPVRVLRSHKAKTKWSPKAGFRYDGLYDVIGMEQHTGLDGVVNWRFELQRRDGQKSWDELAQRPTKAEQDDYEAREYVAYADWETMPRPQKD